LEQRKVRTRVASPTPDWLTSARFSLIDKSTTSTIWTIWLSLGDLLAQWDYIFRYG
jgi:hypothetical protein